MGQLPGAMRWSKGAGLALRFAPVALAAVALLLVLRGLDLLRLKVLLASRGPLLLVIVIPFGVVAFLDSVGWRSLFARIPRSVSLPRLFGVRLTAEAILMSVPSGSLVADSMTPHLLKTRCGVPMTEGVASIAARKCVLALSQALYLGLAAGIGYSALRKASVVTGVHSPERVLLGLALVLLVGGVLFTRLLSGGGLTRALHSLLLKIPSARFRRFLEDHTKNVDLTDAHLARVFHGDVHALSQPLAIYSVCWIIESLETFLILSLLGSGLSYPKVMPMEAALATIRVLVFFVPAGLGVQDLGYVAFLKALGVPGAAGLGAAFVLLKRAKEASFIALGYFLMVKQPALKPIAAP